MSETKTAPVTNERTELFRDLDKPSLHALSYALRHPDTWPQGFIWDYQQCSQCAMGLAHSLWSRIPRGSNTANTGASLMAKAFAIPYSEAKSIFFGDGKWPPMKETTKGHLWWKQRLIVTDNAKVTPEMVADQIDAYLARAE